MSQLFEVEITMHAVIQADDVAHAFILARDSAREMAGMVSLDEVHVGDPIQSIGGLPDGWDGECLPYGGDGKMRIAEILENQPASPDTATADMFSGVAP